MLTGAKTLSGDLVGGEALFREAEAVAQAAEAPVPEFSILGVTAWRGKLQQFDELATSVRLAPSREHRRVRHHPLRPYLARVHLLSGEWLRRTGRRVESRSHLRTAFTLLSEIGCDAFAARAARELKLLGERGRSTPPAINDELTPQELQIAQLQLHLVLEQRPDLSRPNPDD